jgi:hypothetical protein
VVIHGGCWTKGYATARNTATMASALTAKGIVTWNIEYRQVGDEGRLAAGAAEKYRERATTTGDTVEILNVANGGLLDIIAPGANTRDEVETFILKHTFGQKRQTP